MFHYPLNNSKTNWELLLFQMVSLVNLDGFLSLIHSLCTPCGACLWLTGALLSLASQRVTSSCGLDHAASHSVPGISMPASAALHQSAAICPFRQQAETPLSQSQAWGWDYVKLLLGISTSLTLQHRLSETIKKGPHSNQFNCPTIQSETCLQGSRSCSVCNSDLQINKLRKTAKDHLQL